MDGNNVWQYAQPVNNPMEMQPSDGGRKKKGGKGKIVAAILVVAVLLFGVGGFCFYQFVFHTPEARLARGLAILAKEMSTYGAEMQEMTAIKDLMQNIQQDNASDIDMKLDVTLPKMDTIGMDYKQKYDGKNKLMEAEFAFSFFNIPLLGGELAADSEKLYVSLPDIFDDWYYLNTETLGADYQGSVWEEYLGLEVAEDYQLSLFDAEAGEIEEIREEDETLQTEWKALIEEYTPRFAESVTIEDSGNVVEIERDNKTVRCEGVCVTIEKEVLNDFFEDFFELYEKHYDTKYVGVLGELKSDVKICFYMDNKNRIVNISTPEKIKFENCAVESIGFSFVFSGTERTMDKISGNGKIEVAGESFKFELEREAEADDKVREEEWNFKMANEAGKEVALKFTCKMDLKELEYECNMEMNAGEELIGMALEGAFSNIEEGKSMTLEIDEFSLLENEKEMVKISGSIKVGVLEEKIDIPSEATDLMGMTKHEFLDVIMGLVDYTSQFR